MADIIVDAAVFSQSYEVGHRAGPFWKTDLIGYDIYIDNSFSLQYNKTADGGATWAGGVDIEAHICNVSDAWADWQTDGDAGTKIHIAFIDTDDDNIRYIYLDTSDDSVGGDDIILACEGTGAINLTGDRTDHQISITKTRGGNICVAVRYKDSAPTTFEHFYTSPDADTWTDEASPWEAGADDCVLLFPANLADNNDVWALFSDASADTLTLKTYDDSGDSWSEAAITSASGIGGAYINFDGQVRLSDGHLIVAVWNELDAATADLEVWDITDAGTITQKTNVITNEAESAQVSVFINQVNDDQHITYFSGTAWSSLVKAVSQKSADGGVTWDGEIALQADAEDDERWLSAGCMKAAWGGKFQPIWFNDDLNGMFTNTDNGVSIAAEAGGTDWTKSLADTMTIADSISKAFGSSQADSVALADAIGKAPELIKADSMAITDAIAKTVSIVKADTLAITDSIVTALTAATAWVLNLADTVAISDTVTKGIGLVKAETMTITDTLQRITHWVALTLRSRSLGLTLPTRAVSLTLRSRSLSLTLQSRTKSLTLGSRSLSLTLLGR